MESKNETSDLSTQLNQLFQRGFTRAEASGDAKKMWSIFAEELKKYDDHVTTAQNDNINSVLVFTGLFSAIVAVFVVESYKKLSPDSGDRSTVLLEQISQQLAGFQNNTYPPFQPAEPFSPSSAVLWINVLWFLSLVTSIVSGFYVMLAQQWVRRYTQMSQELSGDQGRVRSSLFRGTQMYSISNAIGMMPMLLNISVFLFLSGLIIFLFTISHILATVVTVCAGLFGMAYFVLTILPTIDDVCPYFTPMSDVWWYLWHTPLSAAAFCLCWITSRFRAYSMPCYVGEDTSLTPGILIKLSEVFEDSVKKHTQRIKDGLRGSIVRQALDAPVAADIQALTWLLQRPAMAEKSKIQEFVGSIPEATLLQLSCVPVESGQITIREHLSNLLQSCTQGPVELEEGYSRRRLVCLDAFHNIVKSSTFANVSETVLRDLWSNFEDIELLRKLWADSDPAIRVTSRSICAHLARHLVRKPWLEESELTWLQDITGKSASAISHSLDRPRTVDYMNVTSFVYDVLSKHTDDLAAKNVTRFVETLALLLNAGSSSALSKDIFKGELSALIEWAENDDHEHHGEVAVKLRKILTTVMERG